MKTEELQLLDRHYTKIKIFGRIFYWWNTYPKAVLKHLQELSNNQAINSK